MSDKQPVLDGIHSTVRCCVVAGIVGWLTDNRTIADWRVGLGALLLLALPSLGATLKGLIGGKHD